MTPPAMPLAAPHRNSDASYYSYQSAAQLTPQPQSASSLPYALTPGRINTSTPTFATQQGGVPAAPRGPRSPTSPTSPTRWQNTHMAPTDMPPSYDAGHSSGPLPPEKS